MSVQSPMWLYLIFPSCPLPWPHCRASSTAAGSSLSAVSNESKLLNVCFWMLRFLDDINKVHKETVASKCCTGEQYPALFLSNSYFCWANCKPMKNINNIVLVFLWLSGRALRWQLKRLWVQFPGNTHTDKTIINCIAWMQVALDKSIC